MATVAPPRLLTAKEYEHLDETDGFRDELIEGERVLSPNPILPHTAIIEELERILKGQLKELGAEPLHVVRETGWKFHDPATGTDSVPVPDLMVILEEDLRRAIKGRRWFEGVPLLVIEVVSPSERKARRLQKVGLYLDMGVPNVVEVDYTRRVIRTYTPEADAAAVYREGDQLATPFRASLQEIFAILD